MLVDIHLARPDGTPGTLIGWAEAERNAKTVTLAGKDRPILTGVRPFVVVQESELRAVKEFGL